MARRLLFALSLLVVTAGSFAATHLWLNRVPSGTTASSQLAHQAAAPVLTIDFKPNLLAAASKGRIVGGQSGGVALSWAKDGPETPVDGIFMHTAVEPRQPAFSGRRLKIEIEAEADPASRTAVPFDLQFVQNDLKQSGWIAFTALPERKTYTFNFDALPDTRPADKRMSTLWFRPDRSGAGRGVVIHTARIFVE